MTYFCHFSVSNQQFRMIISLKRYQFDVINITPEAQLGSLQTSKMENLSTIVNSFYPLTIAAKLSILDGYEGSDNSSVRSRFIYKKNEARGFM